MSPSEKTRALLLAHYHAYPQLQLQDLFKFIHQSAFGCEHLVTASASVTEAIQQEFSQISPTTKPRLDWLDGAYCRIPLSYLTLGLSAQTLAQLFCLSAKLEPEGRSALEAKLAVAESLIQEGLLPFSPSQFAKEVAAWRGKNFTALHHSDTFRQQYCPAYRVVASELARFLPLLARLDSLLAQGPVRLAIEGGSASGKTTLSRLLETLYHCTVFHMDDFFLRPEQRTAERFAEPGGNVDRERFLEEVLLPLSQNKSIAYRRFDCSTLTIQPAISMAPQRLTVIEGAYSMHPDLAGHYNLSVFLEIDPDSQKKRIQKRNTPALAERFFHEWIPYEHAYFQALRVKERCDIVIPIEEEMNF